MIPVQCDRFHCAFVYRRRPVLSRVFLSLGLARGVSVLALKKGGGRWAVTCRSLMSLATCDWTAVGISLKLAKNFTPSAAPGGCCVYGYRK